VCVAEHCDVLSHAIGSRATRGCGAARTHHRVVVHASATACVLAGVMMTLRAHQPKIAAANRHLVSAIDAHEGVILKFSELFGPRLSENSALDVARARRRRQQVR
jgi:hypothetical protein